MSRIVYISERPSSNSGGNKIVFRHVEMLQALGYAAAVRGPTQAKLPNWFEHTVTLDDPSRPIHSDDILVLPEDSAALLRQYADLPNRKVVFCQNPYALTGGGLAALPGDLRGRYRTFMACCTNVAGLIARYFDYELISVVPAFADERVFRAAPKEPMIACTPRKRPGGYQTIRYMVERLYAGPTDWRWVVMEDGSETEVAAAMGRASLFLSLARMEALSITTLEAMASQCLIAGFTGIGPREYTTSVNGLWVGEDDCEAAAHALVQVATLADRGGGAVALMRHAAAATAAQWTHARCLDALGSFWRDRMAVAP